MAFADARSELQGAERELREGLQPGQKKGSGLGNNRVVTVCAFALIHRRRCMKHSVVLHSCLALFVILGMPVRSRAQDPAASAQNPPPSPKLDIYGFVMTDFGYDFKSNDPNW